MEVLLWALLLGLIPAFIAKGKGRNFLLWYVYGAAIFIVALIHSLFLKDHSGIQCPACKEWIKEDASVCKHCHLVLTDYYRNNSNDTNQ